MLIVVDPHSGVPVYRQLMDQIRLHIASGTLEPGDELPSTRALSAELGINPMTISKAYSYLEKEEVLERRPGRPLIVGTADENKRLERKIDRLRKSLSPAVTVARQVGVEPDVALEVFRAMLRDGGAEREDERRKEE